MGYPLHVGRVVDIEDFGVCFGKAVSFKLKYNLCLVLIFCCFLDKVRSSFLVN